MSRLGYLPDRDIHSYEMLLQQVAVKSWLMKSFWGWQPKSAADQKDEDQGRLCGYAHSSNDAKQAYHMP
jgi:hypothetical protein